MGQEGRGSPDPHALSLGGTKVKRALDVAGRSKGMRTVWKHLKEGIWEEFTVPMGVQGLTKSGVSVSGPYNVSRGWGLKQVSD